MGSIPTHYGDDIRPTTVTNLCNYVFVLLLSCGGSSSLKHLHAMTCSATCSCWTSVEHVIVVAVVVVVVIVVVGLQLSKSTLVN